MPINYVALKAECQQNPNGYSYTDPGSGSTRTLAEWFASQDDSVCALILNVIDPAFLVYRTAVPVQEINNQITWQNFTPADAVPTAAVSPFTLLETLTIWMARASKAQGMQLNLQNLLLGAQGALDASRAGIRAGLQDALSAVPTGATSAGTFAAGVSLSAGWVGVRDNTLARAARRGEKALATTTVQQNGTTAAKAATLTFEGELTPADIQSARAA